MDEKIHEITLAKRKIVHDEPIVGFTVLNNGKQRRLEFRYDFLGKIMRPRSFRAIEMDKDSFYMAWSENDSSIVSLRLQRHNCKKMQSIL